MHEYELTFLLPGNLEEKALDKALKGVTAYFTKVGAKFKKELVPEKKAMSYEINHQREAYYVFLNISLEADQVSALDNLLRNDDNIIRHLIIKNPSTKTQISKT